ncbi:MAG: glycosyltransferase family 2 protein [Myxococcales bacterium]|nr:glycosyltransferase family 2 protein [Myxococcales bacterium]
MTDPIAGAGSAPGVTAAPDASRAGGGPGTASAATAGSAAHRPVVVVPSYDNPRTVGDVVRAAREAVPDVIVVDDGSAEAGRLAIAALASEPGVVVHRRERNGGKGAAVKDGLRLAAQRGFTHAVQVDADGQHDLADLPKLLAASRASPAALVLATPVFDASAPRGRRWGRRISVFWTRLETGGRHIEDPLCGFRVYPLPIAAEVRARGDRMDFDPEIAVRLVWAGVPTVNIPTRVRYIPSAAGGVSHFQLVRDNVRISLMHSRLMVRRVFRLLFGGLLR